MIETTKNPYMETDLHQAWDEGYCVAVYDILRILDRVIKEAMLEMALGCKANDLN